MEFKKGFYPALGTPLDKDGNLVEESFRKQIELMISAGASGALCMGSMGVEAVLSKETYKKTAEVAVKAVAGRIPLFIGVMDPSVYRIKERLDMIGDLEFDGVVVTAPFYGKEADKDLLAFFRAVADISSKPVYLYDLPAVTQNKITFDMVKELVKHPNIQGIKTPDTVLVRKILREYPDFAVFYSNLDIFDVGAAFGISNFLDGMFTCTPKNAAEFVRCQLAGDIKGAGAALDNILNFRDLMLQNGLWPGYTIAMNLLGLAGGYGRGHNDLTPLPGEVEEITNFMKKIGEL